MFTGHAPLAATEDGHASVFAPLAGMAVAQFHLEADQTRIDRGTNRRAHR